MLTDTDFFLNRNDGELIVRFDAPILVIAPEEFEALRTTVTTLLESDIGRSSKWKTLCLDLTRTQTLNSLGLSLVYWIVSETEWRKRGNRIVVANNHLHRLVSFSRLTRVAKVERIGKGARKRGTPAVWP